MKKLLLLFIFLSPLFFDLKAQDTLQIDITPCDSILDTWTNEEIADLNEFILERPDLFDKSMNICDQAFVYQNYLQLQVVCDSLINSPGFENFFAECTEYLAMDSTLIEQLGMSPTICDSITICYRDFLIDSLEMNACDSILMRDDIGTFKNYCDSLFTVDTFAVQRIVGTYDPEKIDSLTNLLTFCDSLIYCDAQEKFNIIADSILNEISGSDSLEFLSDCDSLIFESLGEDAWTFSEAERIILCNYIFNDLDTTPEEIAEACGITENQLFYIIGRYSRCLRQFGILSPSVLDLNFGNFSISGNFRESEHGARMADIGVSFQPNKQLLPSLTVGLTHVFNIDRVPDPLSEQVLFEKPGLTTSSPLGQEVNDVGLMLMLNQEFDMTRYANVGYEIRANIMSGNSETKNNGYGLVTASLDIDEILSSTFLIDLCGISIELGGFFELIQIDTNGQERLSKFIPSRIRGNNPYDYREYGVSLDLGYKF